MPQSYDTFLHIFLLSDVLIPHSLMDFNFSFTAHRWGAELARLPEETDSAALCELLLRHGGTGARPAPTVIKYLWHAAGAFPFFFFPLPILLTHPAVSLSHLVEKIATETLHLVTIASSSSCARTALTVHGKVPDVPIYYQ